MADDTQDFINSYDAASKPVSMPAKAEALQAGAEASPAPIGTPPAESLPVPAQALPVQPLASTHPMINAYEQAQGANFGKVELPQIQQFNLHMKDLPEKPAEPPSLWDRMVQPVGKFAQGLGGGILGTADTAEAGLETPFRLAAQAFHVPTEAAPSAEAGYESTLPEETKNDPAYKTGKSIGEFGGNVIEGALLPGGAAAKIPAMMGQGAYFSAAESAKQQLQHGGKLDPAELAQSVAFGAGTAGVLGAAGHGIGKMIKGAKANQAMKEKLGNIGKEASENAGEPIEQVRAKMRERLGSALRSHELERLNALQNHLTPNPEDMSSLQKAQRAALTEEPQGPYRLTKRAKGYEAIEHATPLKELYGQLSPKVYKQLKDAVEGIGEALALKKHFENEVEAYARHAISLAKTAAQKAKIEVEENTRLTSAAKETLAKAKSGLYTKQQQNIKAKTQALRDELVDQLKTAPKKLHAELRSQIATLDESLQRLNRPEDILNIPTEKHLYGIANREELHSSDVPRELAPTFAKAYKQFVEASNRLKAASRQYKELSKNSLSAFEDAEKELQDKTENKLARLWVKHPISHPYSGKVTTEMAIGTQFKNHLTYLHGLFQQELQEIETELRAHEENLVKEIAYKIGVFEKLIPQTGKDAYKILKQLGALHPSLDKIGMATALGITSLDNPSNAEDDSTPATRTKLFGNIGMGLLASIVIAKYGPAAANKLFHSQGFAYMRFWANTRDLAHMADKMMGLNPFTQKNAMLGHQLVQLQGKVVEALFMAPDDHEYLMKAAYKEIDPKLLSRIGKKYADEIHDLSKTFKGFIKNYAKEFDKVYDAKNPDEQAYLKPIKDAVNFIYNTVHPPRGGHSMSDTLLAKLFVNASRAWFSANPQQFIANFFDAAISGPLKVGPVATAQGYKAYTSNPVLRGLIDKVVISGPRSEAMQEAVTKAKPLWAENMQARIMSLASMKHYFDTHPRQMHAIVVRKWEDFARKLMEGNVPPDTMADAFIQLSVDLVDTLGHDPISMTKGPLSRSPMGYVIKFVSQPERHARLLVNNLMQGNWKWIAASLGVLWQFGGHSALPKFLQNIGWVFYPQEQAKVQALLDMTSTGQQTLGDMSRKVDYDPFLYPFMGVQSPGLEQILDILGDLPKLRSQVGVVAEAVKDDPHLFLDTKYNPAAEKVQTALRGLVNDMSLLYPTLGPIPIQALSAAAYYLPDVMSGDTKVGIPSPYGLGNTKPLKPGELKTFPKAKETAVRGMLRLPPAPDVSLYRTAETGLKLGGEDPGLETLKERSGVY